MPTASKNLSVFLGYQFSESRRSNLAIQAEVEEGLILVCF